MLSISLRSKILSVAAAVAIVFMVSVLSDMAVRHMGIPISDVVAHLLVATFTSAVTAGFAWVLLSKIEQQSLLANASVTARFEQFQRSERTRTEKVIVEERAKSAQLFDQERRKIQQGIMLASHHYLNNALNQFQLIFIMLEDHGTVEAKLLNEIKASMEKTTQELRELGRMENPTYENVEKFIVERL